MEELKKTVDLLFYEYFQYMLHGSVDCAYNQHIRIILPDVSPRLIQSFRHMLVLLIEKELHPKWEAKTYGRGVTMIEPRKGQL